MAVVSLMDIFCMRQTVSETLVLFTTAGHLCVLDQGGDHHPEHPKVYRCVMTNRPCLPVPNTPCKAGVNRGLFLMKLAKTRKKGSDYFTYKSRKKYAKSTGR